MDDNVLRANIRMSIPLPPQKREEENFGMYCETPFRMCIVGASGTGKTTIVKLVLCYGSDRNPFAVDYSSCIYYCNNPMAKICPSEQNIPNKRYSSLVSYNNLPCYRNSKGEIPHTIIVFDDIPDDVQVRNIITEYIRNGRHKNLSIITCRQNIDDVTQTERNNSTIKVMTCKSFRTERLIKETNFLGLKRTDLDPSATYCASFTCGGKQAYLNVHNDREAQEEYQYASSDGAIPFINNQTTAG